MSRMNDSDQSPAKPAVVKSTKQQSDKPAKATAKPKPELKQKQADNVQQTVALDEQSTAKKQKASSKKSQLDNLKQYVVKCGLHKNW